MPILRKFSPPRLTKGTLNVLFKSLSPYIPNDEKSNLNNQMEVELANLELTKEAFQKNLDLAYMALIVSISAVLIAIAALVVTCIKK